MNTATELIVNDMTCGGCVASITRVIKNLDAQATVAADVTTKRVVVSSQQQSATIIAAIAGAGFNPVLA